MRGRFIQGLTLTRRDTSPKRGSSRVSFAAQLMLAILLLTQLTAGLGGVWQPSLAHAEMAKTFNNQGFANDMNGIKGAVSGEGVGAKPRYGDLLGTKISDLITAVNNDTLKDGGGGCAEFLETKYNLVWDTDKAWRDYLTNVESLNKLATNSDGTNKDALNLFQKIDASKLMVEKNVYALAIMQDHYQSQENFLSTCTQPTANTNLDPNQNKLWKPTNFNLNGTAVMNDDYYVRLQDFWADFQIINKTIDKWKSTNLSKLSAASGGDKIDNKLANNLASTLQGAAREMDKTSNAIKGENEDPCGDYATSKLGLPVPNLINVFCGLSVLYRRLSVSILYTAGSLIASQGDMLPAPLQGNIGQPAGAELLIDLSSLNAFQSPVEQVVSDPDDAVGKLVADVYSKMLGLLDYLLLVVFLIIALANILQIQLNTYAIKKVVPGLVIGFLVAHGSMLVMRISLEVSGVLARQVMQIGQNPGEAASGHSKGMDNFVNAFSNFPFTQEEIRGPGCSADHYYYTIACSTDKSSPILLGKVFKQIVTSTFTLVPAIMLFVLGFLFVIRRIVFYALLPLAPIAFASAFFPPAVKLWDRWWKLASSWLFMPVVAAFWLWLGMMWLGLASGTSSLITAIFSYTFAMVAVYAAMKTPFSMAGEAKMAVDKWNRGGKAVWKATGGAAVGAGLPKASDVSGYSALNRLRNSYAQAYKDRGELRKNGPIIQGGPLAGTAAGQAINRHPEKMKLNAAMRKNTQETQMEEAKTTAQEMQQGSDQYQGNTWYRQQMLANKTRGAEAELAKNDLKQGEEEMSEEAKRETQLRNTARLGRLADRAKDLELDKADTELTQKEIQSAANLRRLRDPLYRARKDRLTDREQDLDLEKKEGEGVEKEVKAMSERRRLADMAYVNRLRTVERHEVATDQISDEVKVTQGRIKSQAKLREMHTAGYQAAQQMIERERFQNEQGENQIKAEESLLKSGQKDIVASTAPFQARQRGIETTTFLAEQAGRSADTTVKGVKAAEELRLSQDATYLASDDRITEAAQQAERESSQAKLAIKRNFLMAGGNVPVAQARQNQAYEDDANKALLERSQNNAKRDARLRILAAHDPGPTNPVRQEMYRQARRETWGDIGKAVTERTSATNMNSNLDVHRRILHHESMGDVQAAHPNETAETFREAVIDLLNIKNIISNTNSDPSMLAAAAQNVQAIANIDPTFAPMVANTQIIYGLINDPASFNFDRQNRENLRREFSTSILGQAIEHIRTNSHQPFDSGHTAAVP